MNRCGWFLAIVLLSLSVGVLASCNAHRASRLHELPEPSRSEVEQVNPDGLSTIVSKLETYVKNGAAVHTIFNVNDAIPLREILPQTECSQYWTDAAYVLVNLDPHNAHEDILGLVRRDEQWSRVEPSMRREIARRKIATLRFLSFCPYNGRDQYLERLLDYDFASKEVSWAMDPEVIFEFPGSPVIWAIGCAAETVVLTRQALSVEKVRALYEKLHYEWYESKDLDDAETTRLFYMHAALAQAMALDQFLNVYNISEFWLGYRTDTLDARMRRFLVDYI